MKKYYYCFKYYKLILILTLVSYYKVQTVGNF